MNTHFCDVIDIFKDRTAIKHQNHPPTMMARRYAARSALLCLATLLQLTLAFVVHPTSTHWRSHSFKTAPLYSSSRAVIDWAKQQTLEELVPKEDAYKIIDELLHNDALIDSTESQFNDNWDSLEKRLRDEDRSLSQILGASTTTRIIDSVSNIEYDKDVISTFLNSNAINSLFAMVLYDGISEFTQRIDIFGNIVNSLPIIGPIRQQITKQFKDQLDRSLGPLIRNFLQAYTKIAVKEAIDFVLSPENQKLFSSANQNLANNLLQRPVNTLLPPSDISTQFKEDIFQYIRNDVNMTDVERYLDVVYDLVEDKSVEDFVDVNQVLNASPTLESTLDNIWTKMKIADDSATND